MDSLLLSPLYGPLCPTIERAALGIEDRLRRSGRLVYAGAGTSGRLAVQDGAELMPTFSWPRDRLLLLIAGGEEAMVRAVEGAEDERSRAPPKSGAITLAPTMFSSPWQQAEPHRSPWPACERRGAGAPSRSASPTIEKRRSSMTPTRESSWTPGPNPSRARPA